MNAPRAHGHGLALTAFLALLLAAGCATGHCRKPIPSPPPPSEDKISESTEHIFVYKPDGSLMCKQGRPIPLEEMQQQLKGIKVFSAKKKRDGLMHVLICGSPTGMHNVFEIFEKNLPAAEKRGFKKWLY